MFFLPPFLPETACLRFGGLIFRQERGRRRSFHYPISCCRELGAGVWEGSRERGVGLDGSHESGGSEVTHRTESSSLIFTDIAAGGGRGRMDSGEAHLSGESRGKWND